MEKEFIFNSFNEHKLALNEEQINQFLTYYRFLIETNKSFNLTAITDFEEVVEKHFLDSCLNADHFSKGASVCDIGSGAGFPALPLKILRPDLQIIMVDSLNKRVNFLQELVKKLHLQNTKAIHSRAQELYTICGRETFDYTTARAVAPLNILLEFCAPYTKVGGEVVALKSKNADAEIDQAQHAITTLGLTLKNVDNYSYLSNNEEITRKIIYFTKIKHTPAIYPRPKNLIKTNSL